MVSDEVVTFGNVQAGAICPIRLAQALATGTTAGGLRWSPCE